MENRKTTFALFFGNRGFFPGELIASARKDMQDAMERNGFDYIIMEEKLTRYGAVETIEEGKLYNNFLKEHEGEFDGVILSLPNFGDENGASVALNGIDVPVLVQAYPDEKGKMDFAHRRDSLCGKIAMCNVLRQCKIKYTLTENAVVAPNSKEFDKDLDNFAAICRIVRKLKNFNIGAIGARTTAFKTVRIDEIAMQNKNINVETIDLSVVFDMMDKVEKDELSAKMEYYSNICDFGTYPPEKLENISRLGVVMDKLIKDYNLHAVGIRCWNEFETKYGFAPCLVLSDLNEKGIPAACELDINNAIMMYALQEASNSPVMLLDANNNYHEEKDKMILFHCSAIPQSFFKGKTKISEHLMFKKSFGEGTGVGSFKTEDGKLCAFTAEMTLTDDPIEDCFFGCGVVAQSDSTEDILKYMCENGYRHHIAIAKGSFAFAVKEAMEKYLDYNTDIL